MAETETKPGSEIKIPTDPQLEFDKYKTKLELYKWLVGSVALVLVTTVIDFGFRDRAAGLQELQQYDKYVTELIVLNKEPAQKRMLAQFFAYVTPSKKLKDGWNLYFKEVDKEYQVFIAPILENDSIVKAKYNSILADFNGTDSIQIQQLGILEEKMESNDRIIHPEINLPSIASINNDNSALEWEEKGFSFLQSRDVENAIFAFQNSEDAHNQFHQVYEIANYLRDNKSKLIDPKSEFWNTAYKKITEDYSWKMPVDVKRKLIEFSR